MELDDLLDACLGAPNMRVTERRGRGGGVSEHDCRCCFTKAKKKKASFLLGLAESVVMRRREHEDEGEVEADEVRCIAVHARSWCARRIILSA